MTADPRHDPDAVPPCPVCGALLDVDWFDVRTLAENQPRLIPGEARCGDRPHHDVSRATRLFGTVEVAHHDHHEPRSCPLYLLDHWRAKGWFPTTLEHQTAVEAVQHRVWQLATDTP